MILFIDAACRENSRTRRYAKAFLERFNEPVKELKLYDIQIPLLDEKAIIEREKAFKSQDNTNPFVSLAMEFRRASTIVVCAPYWDLGYPAILRSYLEAIMVCGITFTYDQEGNAVGRCAATRLYYFTTSGGRIERPNLGYSHINKLATTMLGIKETYYFSAEGLDIEGANPETILDEKIKELSSVDISLPQVTSYDRQQLVMIVDDSTVNILKAEYILQENGYKTVGATSGAECLKKLKRYKPDIILLDIKMPDMDGFETLDAIRNIPKYEKTPVFFVTGDNSVENVLEAVKHRISGYITKPFSEEELITHMNKIRK